VHRFRVSLARTVDVGLLFVRKVLVAAAAAVFFMRMVVVMGCEQRVKNTYESIGLYSTVEHRETRSKKSVKRFGVRKNLRIEIRVQLY